VAEAHDGDFEQEMGMAKVRQKGRERGAKAKPIRPGQSLQGTCMYRSRLTHISSWHVAVARCSSLSVKCPFPMVLSMKAP